MKETVRHEKLTQRIHHHIERKRMEIMLCAIAVVVLSLVATILGTVIGRRGSGALQTQYETACADSLQQAEVSFDIVLSNIIDLAMQYYDDVQLDEMIGKETLSYADITFLTKRVNALTYSNHFIDSTALYLEESGAVIVSGKGIFAEENYADRQLFDWYQENANRLQIQETYPLQNGYFPDQTHDVIALYVRLPIRYHGQTEGGAMAIYLEHDYLIRNLISPLLQSDVNFFVTSQQGRIILSDDPAMLYRPIGDIDIRESGLVRHQGKPMVAVHCPMERTDWQLTGLYPVWGISEQTKSLVLYIIILCILSIMAGAFVCWLFIHRIIRPVDETIDYIKSSYESPDEDLKTVFEKLMSSRQEMNLQLNTAQAYARDKAMLDLVQKKMTRMNRQKLIDDYSLNIFTCENLYLMLISLDESNLEDNELEQLVLIDDAERALEGCGLMAQGVGMNATDIVMLASCPDAAAMQQAAEKMLGILRDKEPFSIRVVLCDHSSALENLHADFEQTFEILSLYRPIETDKVILISQEMLLPAERVSDMLLHALTVAIRSGDREHTTVILEHFLNRVQEVESILYIGHQLYRLEDMFRSFGIESDGKMTFQGDLKKVRARYFSYLDALLANGPVKSADRRQRIYQAINAYIQEHYAEDVSLTDVCNELSISATYVNQILKQFSGKTFLRVLNEYRIYVASRMLENTDASIKEVSQQVGFSSQTYFIKVFKELIGVTPGKIRNDRS